MKFKIELASLSDLDQIANLWIHSIEYHHDMAPEYYIEASKQVLGMLKLKTAEIINNSKEYLYYIEVANNKVGFIYFGSDSPNYFDCVVNSFGLIYEIYVLDSYQSQGLGRLLMQHAENKLKDEGFEYVFLQLTAANKKAKDFYLQNRYQETQIIMNKKL